MAKISKRSKVIPAQVEQVIEEVIVQIVVKKDSVLVQYADDYGSRNTVNILISGTSYDDLMSGKPDWNKNKLKGLFNTNDLWYVVTNIENGVYDA